MSPLEALRRQLENFVAFHRTAPPSERRFLCIEDLVLKHGTHFPHAVQTPPVRPIAKACFEQCYRLALRRERRWVYCEGYAMKGDLGLGVHHAWVTRACVPGEAVDLAWSDGNRRNTAYIGIPFKAEYVRKVHWASKRQMFSVLDAWWLHYPLVTGETRIEDVIWEPEEIR